MSPRTKMKIGDFVLDPSRNVLIGAEAETALEPKVVDVLSALAARPGAVLSRDELIAAVWKTAFGGDERLTRAISHLRKAFHDERGRARYIETVSKRGYRLIAPVSRAETAPQGGPADIAEPAAEAPMTADASVEAIPATPSRRSRLRRAHAVAGALAALVMTGIAAAVWRDAHSFRDQVFVAVLPFDDESSEKDLEVFAEGLTEEILYTLSKASDIAVAARSSSFKFTTRQADEAAKALNATHLVEGTVRKEGDEVRVGVLLKDTHSQTVIWSETFARRATQILQMQDDVSWRVADALGARLTQGPDMPDIDPKTYKRYLLARDLLRLRKVRLAVSEFEAVVEREPKFARAWAGLAVSRFLSSGYLEDETGVWPAELVAAAQQAIDRTLALDPHNGEVLGIMALRTFAEGRLRETEDLYDRALAAEPSNPTLLNWRATFYVNVGRGREALLDISRAYRLDRLSPPISANFAMALISAGRLGEARAMLDGGRVGPESYTLTIDVERDILARNGDWDALVRYAQQPQFAAAATPYADIYALIGETAAMLAGTKEIERATLRERWNEIATDAPLHSLAVEYLSYVGDVDGSMAHLQALASEPERWGSVGTAFMPFARALREDHRFIDLMETVGLWDYWRESGHWPDFCAEPRLTYDCNVEAERPRPVATAR